MTSQPALPTQNSPRRRLSVDGVRRKTAVAGTPAQASAAPQPVRRPMSAQTRQQPAPVKPQPQTAVQAHQPIPKRPQPLPPVQQRPSAWRRLQTPAIIIGGMIAGFGMQTLAFGLVAVALYGIAAIIFRIYSRTTFTLALIALIAVPVILVGRQNSEVAGNFATYTFLLIVIGIISLLRESPDSGQRYLHNKKRMS